MRGSSRKEGMEYSRSSGEGGIEGYPIVGVYHEKLT